MTTRRDFLKIAAITAAAVTGTGMSRNRLFADGVAAGADAAAAAPVALKQTIDWHNHWISPKVIDLFKQRTSLPRVDTDGHGKLAFFGTLSTPLPLTREFSDVDARLDQIAKAGIDRQVISWPTTLGADALLSADEAKPIWTAYNNDLSDLVRAHPDKFSGLAVLPTSDTAWAADELERAHTQLGLIGVVLPVGAFQSQDSFDKLAPIFEVAQKHHSHIYLHTGPASVGFPGQWDPKFIAGDAPAIRGTLETGATFAQGANVLVQSGVQDRYPDVTIQIAMLGGVASFGVGGGMPGGNPAQNADATADSHPFGNIYFDTGVFGRSPHIVNFAAAKLGSDRILFGSDYPLAPTETTIASVKDSGLASSDLSRIFVDNGQALFAKIGRAVA
jgi:predicted TIM-barrel fold metal-dependent hydrolase